MQKERCKHTYISAHKDGRLESDSLLQIGSQPIMSGLLSLRAGIYPELLTRDEGKKRTEQRRPKAPQGDAKFLRHRSPRGGATIRKLGVGAKFKLGQLIFRKKN